MSEALTAKAVMRADRRADAGCGLTRKGVERRRAMRFMGADNSVSISCRRTPALEGAGRRI